MTPDFEHPPERRGTDSVKWDLKPHTPDGRSILPMWVADMDFPIPDVVQSALRERISHPVFGYSYLSAAHQEAFVAWQRRRNSWEIDREWLVYAPGVMPAVRAAIRTFTEPGDEVIMQPPVYNPFFCAIRDSGRVVVENPLVAVNHSYQMDLEHLEAQISDRTRMLILCSPHNPVGRVWTPDELIALAELCGRHNLTIVCDEIHGDLIREGHSFTPLASISPEISSRTITCAAPTKTFNIAGLASSFAIVEDPRKREALAATIERLGLDLPNTLSLTAATAAYSNGAEWLDALLEYLNATYDWFEREFATRFPRLGLCSIQGTYLAWIDFRELMESVGADDTAVQQALLDVGGLWLSEGSWFGTAGQGFQRMNLACPRDVIRDGLDRLEIALGALS
ncbi:MAG: pyridoxal phosphate-dependent aminotransferase [Spirochaetales bacterium]|nr:pyridoxal phosphate-dependent aminotransferase [Spirochaetales bacterium]